jgi:hypothetical protein
MTKKKAKTHMLEWASVVRPVATKPTHMGFKTPV